MRNPTPNPPARSSPIDATRRQRGGTLVEVTLAMGLLATISMGTMGTMIAARMVEVEVSDRALALRAAESRIETLQAYGWADDVGGLLDHLGDAANRSFSVEGLAAPAAQVGTPAGQHAQITFDASDASRISVSITVSWTNRAGSPRSLTLPTTITGISS